MRPYPGLHIAKNHRGVVQVIYTYFHLLIMYLVPGLIVAAHLYFGDQISTGQITGWNCVLGVLAIIIVLGLLAQFWWLILILFVGGIFEVAQESRGLAVAVLFAGIAVVYYAVQYIKKIPEPIKEQARGMVWRVIKVPWFLCIAVTTIGLFAGFPKEISVLAGMGSLLWSIMALTRVLYSDLAQ